MGIQSLRQLLSQASGIDSELDAVINNIRKMTASSEDIPDQLDECRRELAILVGDLQAFQISVLNDGVDDEYLEDVDNITINMFNRMGLAMTLSVCSQMDYFAVIRQPMVRARVCAKLRDLVINTEHRPQLCPLLWTTLIENEGIIPEVDL